jgi:hypothetical protein
MMSPFRAGCAVEPSQPGQHQTAACHWIVLIVFPSRNPTQGRGSHQMVLIHRKPPLKREDNTPWIAPAADNNPSLEGADQRRDMPRPKKMSPGAMAQNHSTHYDQDVDMRPPPPSMAWPGPSSSSHGHAPKSACLLPHPPVGGKGRDLGPPPPINRTTRPPPRGSYAQTAHLDGGVPHSFVDGIVRLAKAFPELPTKQLEVMQRAAGPPRKAPRVSATVHGPSRHTFWNPNGPEVCVHVDRLMAVCDVLRLTLSSPVKEGPTHFPYNKDLMPTVIDLMFVPAEVSLTTEHEIHPDLRGTSDHAPLMVTLPGPDSEVPVTCWSIQAGSDEEQAYLGEVFFFFFCQQFITQGSLAVRRPAVQTVHTLRLRYALPITTYQVLKASFWRATTDIRPAASSKTTSPFRAVNAGASQQATEIAMSIPRLPLERSPDRNPPQRVGQLPEGVKPL